MIRKNNKVSFEDILLYNIHTEWICIMEVEVFENGASSMGCLYEGSLMEFRKQAIKEEKYDLTAYHVGSFEDVSCYKGHPCTFIYVYPVKETINA